MRIGYFECFSGASGDMILAALLDAGARPEILDEIVHKLGDELHGVEIVISDCERSHLRGKRVEVVCAHEHHAHRSFSDIKKLIESSSLDPIIIEMSVRIFRRLAEAEGKLHGKPPEEVTFHEVGAIDSIVDTVGAAALIHSLGIQRIHVSTFSLGRGRVKCAHGLLPTPAPATLELLKGFETMQAGVEGELLTPTGAAILTTIAEQTPPPSFILESIGYGAGKADRHELPNLLRFSMGAVRSGDSESHDRIWVLETNVDDMPAEICGNLHERMAGAGALDVFITPVSMKKSRPGLLITCLAPMGREHAVEDALFAETTTFGVRKHLVERAKLEREIHAVETEYGKARVKVGRREGRIVTVSPEYEDCRKLAEKSGVPLRVVYEAAAAKSREQFSEKQSHGHHQHHHEH